MPEFIFGIVEGHMRCALFVRLVGIIVFAWILAQSAALAQGADDVGTFNDQAEQLYNQGKYAEALKLTEQARAFAETALGPDHPETLRSVNNLGTLYYTKGRYDEAEPLYRQALAGREKALGLENPDTLRSVNNLGLLYQALGRYGEAESLYKRSLTGFEKALGLEHRHTLRSVNSLGFLYHTQGRYDEAEPLYKRALARYEKVLGSEHPNTLTSVNSLAVLYRVQGRLRGHPKGLALIDPSTPASSIRSGMAVAGISRRAAFKRQQTRPNAQAPAAQLRTHQSEIQTAGIR